MPIAPQILEFTAISALLVAVMITLSQRVIHAIEQTHREAEESFEAGFELGRDKGYLEGRRTGRPQLVVTDMDEARASRPPARPALDRHAKARGGHTAW